jgi:hypothetical protein
MHFRHCVPVGMRFLLIKNMKRDHKYQCSIVTLWAVCRHKLALDAWHKTVLAVHQRVQLQASIDAEERLNSITTDSRRKELERTVARVGKRVSTSQSKPRHLNVTRKSQKSFPGSEHKGEEGAGMGLEGLRKDEGLKRKKGRTSEQPKKRARQHSVARRGAGGGSFDELEDESLREMLRRLVQAHCHPQDTETL